MHVPQNISASDFLVDLLELFYEQDLGALRVQSLLDQNGGSFEELRGNLRSSEESGIAEAIRCIVEICNSLDRLDEVREEELKSLGSGDSPALQAPLAPDPDRHPSFARSSGSRIDELTSSTLAALAILEKAIGAEPLSIQLQFIESIQHFAQDWGDRVRGKFKESGLN